MNTYANRGYQDGPEYEEDGMQDQEDSFEMNEQWHEDEFDENVSHASSRAAGSIVDPDRSTRLRNQMEQSAHHPREVAPRASSPGIKRATNVLENRESQYDQQQDIQGPYEEDEEYEVVSQEVIHEEVEGTEPEHEGQEQYDEDEDPEERKDFGSAYDKLVEKIHLDQGSHLLISEHEYQKAMEKKEMQKNMKERTEAKIKDFNENKRRKMELIKQENENKELEECTFKPNLISKNVGGRRRKLDEFLADQRKHEEEKAIKRNIILEQESQVEAGVVHHPAINETSRKMIAKRRNQGQPVHERLYGISKANKKINQIIEDVESENIEQSEISSQVVRPPKKQTNSQKNETFAPVINARSKDIVRDQPVQDLLYNDALRRKDMNALRKQKIIKESTKKKSNVNEINIEYLIHRFNKEFEPTFEAVAQQGEEGPSEILNYRQLGELLFDMGFLSGSASSESEERILLSSMWTGLGGADNDGLHKEVIRAFLLAVEGVKITEPIDSPSEEEFGIMKDGEFYPDCKKISKNFKLMYLNRIRHSRDGAKRKIIKAENEASQD